MIPREDDCMFSCPRRQSSGSLCLRRALSAPRKAHLIREFTGPSITVTYLQAKVHENRARIRAFRMSLAWSMAIARVSLLCSPTSYGHVEIRPVTLSEAKGLARWARSEE